MFNSTHQPFADETSLVAAVIRKDERAFRVFIERFEKLVMHIVFKMITNQHDREDLCQEVFLKAYEKLSSFRFQSKLSSWIGNIAFNACINFLQKKKGILIDDVFRANDEDEITASKFPTADLSKAPDEMLLTKEKINLLHEAINQLNPIQRTILQLFHNDECSLEEISAIAGLPVNTVKSHLFRARKLLKQQLINLINQ